MNLTELDGVPETRSGAGQGSWSCRWERDMCAFRGFRTFREIE